MITLTTLVQIAPFDGETRAMITAKLGTLTPDQERQLTELAWQTITSSYQGRLNKEIDLALLDMQEGKKEYSKDVFTKIQDQLLLELTSKIEAGSTNEEMASIKEEITKHIAPAPTPPPPQPQPITQPPQPPQS